MMARRRARRLQRMLGTSSSCIKLKWSLSLFTYLRVAGYQELVDPQHKPKGGYEVPESKLPLLLFHRAHSLRQTPISLR